MLSYSSPITGQKYIASFIREFQGIREGARSMDHHNLVVIQEELDAEKLLLQTVEMVVGWEAFLGVTSGGLSAKAAGGRGCIDSKITLSCSSAGQFSNIGRFDGCKSEKDKN